MRHIPTLYKRDGSNDVIDELEPTAAWVFDTTQSVTATYKWNGWGAKFDRDGRMWKSVSYDTATETPDRYFVPDGYNVGGVAYGWLPVGGDESNKADSWYIQAWEWWQREDGSHSPPPGSYEVVGPKVEDNPHDVDTTELRAHGGLVVVEALLAPPQPDFAALTAWFQAEPGNDAGFEGIVWHNRDGRMAKLKVSDFA